ncbi:MAG TPA: hypothetical protein VFC78_12695, partial [Tepidisphaeraceae bacterium]|nr:hypothetical protein [Tepidisphaeraceae bacterium]
VAANTPSVIQQACGHEFVSFLKLGNSRGDGHVHFFSSTTYAKAGRTSFLLHRQPQRLLLVSTGNITNFDLEEIFRPQIPAIAVAFKIHYFVEITTTSLVIHE